MVPVVHLRGAVSLLGRFPALAGADLDVEPGEVVLLRGPNGAGKTTLLRVCAGLLPVTAGTAEVLGVDLVQDRAAVRRRVGLVGHGGGLYDDLTVAENVAFWGRATGAGAEDVAGALARLGLDGRLRDLPVTRLSAGQRRRTSIAAMVARRPELWLLDEPHASLDADGRDLVDELVRASVAAGATVVLASHEDDRAVALATRVVEVRGGTTVVPVAGDAGGEVPRAG
jgi:heme ABC exporter ATP-binding subunit CcmA